MFSVDRVRAVAVAAAIAVVVSESLVSVVFEAITVFGSIVKISISKRWVLIVGRRGEERWGCSGC